MDTSKKIIKLKNINMFDLSRIKSIKENSPNTLNNTKMLTKDENKISYKEPSDLLISTYTMTSNLNDTIDLFILSRLIPIYNENDSNTKDKEGCFISISDYTEESNTDLPRGHIDEAIKLHVFNNQISLYYKYWDFKKVNVKIFTNGKLQLTGIKDPWEATYVSEVLKKKLENLDCIVYNNKKKLKDINNIDFAFVWNKKKGKVDFYRKKIDIYNIKHILNKGMVYVFDNKLDRQVDTSNNHLLELNYEDLNVWEHEDAIRKKLDSFKNDALKEIVLLKKLQNKLLNLYDFNYNQKEQIINTINSKYSNIIKINKKKIINDDNKFKKIVTQTVNKLIKTLNNYNTKLEKCFQTDSNFTKIIDIAFKKIINYYNIDELNNINNISNIDPLSKINSITENNVNNTSENYDVNSDDNINLDENISIMELLIDKISKLNLSKYDIIYDDEMDIKIKIQDLLSKKYKVDNITTELINSDFNTNFNINLSKVSNVLKNKYAIYNYYQPNNKYPGVIIKFYYNKENLKKENYKIGVCNCDVNCAEKDSKTCTVISISVFRPGSIIITAAKNIDQLVYAYNFINTFLKTNFKDIIYPDDFDNSKQHEINQKRKICRKSHLYYINKKDIINLPK